MASSDFTPEVIYIAETYVIGNMFPLVFGSALTLACATFVHSCTTENRVIRLSVVAAGILVAVHVILAFADTVRAFGLGFGNIERVSALSPVSVAAVLVGAVAAAEVQSFYAWRCYRLLGNRLVLLVVLGILILFSLGTMIAACIKGLTSSSADLFTTGTSTSFIFFRLPYIAGLATDVVLCMLTLYALYQAKSQGHSQGVGKFITKLVLLTVSSNGLTAAFLLVLLIVSKHATGVFWALMNTSCEVYVFTLIVWLYSRRSNTLEAQPETNGHSGESRLARIGIRRSAHFRSPSGSPKSGILVHTERVTVVSGQEKGEESFSDDYSLSEVEKNESIV